MDANEYQQISAELQHLCKTIPLHWGNIQNNKTDAKINMFYLKTKKNLDDAICNLPENEKIYFRRRWFLWQCSRVDEYLFYSDFNVQKNPNTKDQNWDIEFYKDKNLRFDVKGTVVPKIFRKNFKTTDEEKIIQFYYNNQSKGVRFNHQNRLFIVHHSNYKTERSLFLRCHWKLKEKAYKSFINNVKKNPAFTTCKTAIAKCIFILENNKNEFSFQIH